MKIEKEIIDYWGEKVHLCLHFREKYLTFVV